MVVTSALPGTLINQPPVSEKWSALPSSAASYTDDVSRLLRALTASEQPEWRIRSLDVGRATGIFLISASDRAPIYRDHRALVLKMYAPALAPPVATVLGQYHALRRLRAQLHGCSAHGWTIMVPEPLHVSESPLGLVMTLAPGIPLSASLERDRWNKALLISAARAIVTAMQRVWWSGDLHGDLIFQNILCDIERRSISFVDAGVMPDCHFSTPATLWHPSVHDFAHILADTSTSLEDVMPWCDRNRKREFAETLVVTFLATHRSDERRVLLDQLYECTRLHIQAKPSFKLPRLLAAMKRQIGYRLAFQTIARMRHDVERTI
jgi:hypothetical protein